MWQRLEARLAALRFDLREASGALGDLGTFARRKRSFACCALPRRSVSIWKWAVMASGERFASRCDHDH